MSKLCSVSTTIQPPTPAVRRLCRALRRVASQLLVLGDRKGLAAYSLAGAEFFALDRQLALPLRLPQLLPVNHYSRKNLGYLVAISRAAECIYETDDDNAPSAGWQLRNRTVQARKVNGPRDGYLAKLCRSALFVGSGPRGHLPWPRSRAAAQLPQPAEGF